MNIEVMNVINQHPIIVTIVLVSIMILKGVALWKSAKANQPYWFVAILVINLLGILEMVYIAFFAPKNKSLKK